MNQTILQTEIHRVDFLGQTLGPDYEIALYDTSNPIHSVIAIANSHITGREIGAPLTNIMLQLIAEKHYQKENSYLHYTGSSPGKRNLRSSILYLKNRDQELIGILCINFDDSRYMEISTRILRLCHPDYFFASNFSFTTNSNPSPAPSLLPSDIPAQQEESRQASSIEEFMQQITQNYTVTLDKLSVNEKLKLLSSLKEKGFFNIRGSVSTVAKYFDCSQSSIYRYLSKLSS